MFLIHWTWCLPQALLGACWYQITRASGEAGEPEKFKNARAAPYDRSRSGVSLGHFLFYPKGDSKTLAHEYGHYKQSLMLGPLYLPVVGVPSFMWSLYYKKFKPEKSYYSFITERWADRLAGIDPR